MKPVLFGDLQAEERNVLRQGLMDISKEAYFWSERVEASPRIYHTRDYSSVLP